jgi:hypothetical protein
MERDQKIELFLCNFERCLRGLRDRNTDEALGQAEVHAAVLFLVEDEDFAAKFKSRWDENYAEDNAQPWVNQPVDTLPALAQCFVITLCKYMGIG